ncbi:MAG: hypothetical protein EPN37_13000 [Chitinophagaceae bacterium]|nr:MAG: hypothetical protein EPN37_13000 [Chitinophagaceae bacterium]
MRLAAPYRSRRPPLSPSARYAHNTYPQAPGGAPPCNLCAPCVAVHAVGGAEGILLFSMVCPANDAAQLPLCQHAMPTTQRHPCAAWPANARPRTPFFSTASAPLPPVFSGFNPSPRPGALAVAVHGDSVRKYSQKINMQGSGILKNSHSIFPLLTNPKNVSGILYFC